MEEKEIALKDLFNELLSSGAVMHSYNDYEVIDCTGMQILTLGNKYVNLLWLSRHKTNKQLIKVSVESKALKYDVTVTTDHVCMVYNKDHFFENVNAKNLKVSQFVSVYDKATDKEYIGTIVSIENIGTTDEFVYDCEVDDDVHAFYANGIFLHNSQFLNIQCISKMLIEKYGLSKHISEWPQERRQELWDITKEFVHKDLTPYVRKLVHNFCKSNQQDALSYDLEYMADVGLFEGRKHYAIHKIFDEGDAVDKTKYAGIELKKAQVPKQMKRYLADIYDGAMMKHWSSLDYEKYICDLYDNFKQFSIDEISFWKGYNTERQAVGFLEMAVGTTGIAKACIYYNQVIQKLGLGKKYEEIRVGDKVRFCYIDRNNDYGIKCIAYKPDQWPKEFAKLFKPDYRLMFQKVILDPLKKFRQACNFNEIDPGKQVQFDIFTI